MNLFKNFLFTFAAISFSSTTFAEEKVCRDDARLYVINTVVKQIDSGQSVKPLKLTAETFVSLTPELRIKLADNILVYDSNCTAYQVYQGKPPIPIAIAFERQLHFFTQSLARGDEQAANFSIDLFTPIPKPIHELIHLVAPIDMAPPAAKQLEAMKLLKVVGMRNSGSSSKSSTYCRKKRALNTLLDLFVLFGGIVSNKERAVAIHEYNDSLHLFAGTTHFHNSSGQKFDGASCSPFNQVQVAAQLKRAGADILVFTRDHVNFKPSIKQAVNAANGLAPE